jgi:chromosome segregation ATPase
MISIRILVLLGLLLTYFTIDAATKGKFTAMPPPPEIKQEIVVMPEETKQRIETQRVELLNERDISDELRGRIDELENQMRDALNTIGSLTSELQSCQAQNDKLRKELKKALENLDFVKKQYENCETRLGHQYMKNQYCNMKSAPNLLR